MDFTEKELNYLAFMLDTASPFRINRAEEVIVPGVKHSHLKLKIKKLCYNINKPIQS
jgi:hypothetical protein